VRRVSVQLEADVASYLAGIEASTRATRQLANAVARLDRQLDRIPASAALASAAVRRLSDETARTDLNMRNLRDRTNETDRSLRRTPDSAASVARALRLLGIEGEGAGAHLRWVGGGGDSLRVLDTHLASTRNEVRRLGEEFNRTGSIDVFRRLGESEQNMRSLELLRRRITGAVDDGVQDGVQDGVRSAAGSPRLMHVGLLLGAGLAVPLLAAIGGAITGLAGFGVAGLGVAGAIMGDPKRFQAEWGAAANDLKTEFLGATAVITGPALAAVRGLGPLIQSWHIDTMFANAAKYVEPLVRGVEGFASGIVRGVSAMVDKGGPAVEALSAGLVELGDAADDAFTSIAGGAEGGGEALRDVLFFTADAIRLFGDLTAAAEDAYSFVHDHPVLAAVESGGLSLPITLLDQFSDKSDEVHGTLTKLGDSAATAAVDFEALGKALGHTAATADSLAGAMVGKIFAATMGLDQAVLGVAESLTRLDETMDKNGRTIDRHTGLVAMNTEKGQANREAVLAAVTANMSLYQAQLSAGMSAEDAAKNYDANTAALERQLRKAGLTTAQIDDLIGKYRGIPKQVDTDIAINGLTDAINGLAQLIREINGIKDKTVNVTVYYHSKGQSLNAPLAHGGIRRAATGMIIAPSDPGTTLVGEPQTGGEALIPLQGISQSRAMGLMQTAGAGYGLDVVPRDGARQPGRHRHPVNAGAGLAGAGPGVPCSDRRHGRPPGRRQGRLGPGPAGKPNTTRRVNGAAAVHRAVRRPSDGDPHGPPRHRRDLGHSARVRPVPAGVATRVCRVAPGGRATRDRCRVRQSHHPAGAAAPRRRHRRSGRRRRAGARPGARPARQLPALAARHIIARLLPHPPRRVRPCLLGRGHETVHRVDPGRAVRVRDQGRLDRPGQQQPELRGGPLRLAGTDRRHDRQSHHRRTRGFVVDADHTARCGRGRRRANEHPLPDRARQDLHRQRMAVLGGWLGGRTCVYRLVRRRRRLPEHRPRLGDGAASRGVGPSRRSSWWHRPARCRVPRAYGSAAHRRPRMWCTPTRRISRRRSSSRTTQPRPSTACTSTSTPRASSVTSRRRCSCRSTALRSSPADGGPRRLVSAAAAHRPPRRSCGRSRRRPCPPTPPSNPMTR
jgi:hypothetical protein